MVSDNPLGGGKVRRREWRQSCADFPVHNRVDFKLRFSGESRIGQIFISYRREDSSASAGSLFDILRNHFAAKSNCYG